MRAYACFSMLALVGLACWLRCWRSRPATSTSDAAQARVHFERGKTYFEVDEYKKAIEEFKAAHIQRPDPAFLYNIAECYRRAGEPRDALVFYRRFLSAAPAGDKTRAIVDKRIVEMQAAIDAEPKSAPPALLRSRRATRRWPAPEPNAPTTALIGQPSERPPADARPALQAHLVPGHRGRRRRRQRRRHLGALARARPARHRPRQPEHLLTMPRRATGAGVVFVAAAAAAAVAACEKSDSIVIVTVGG